MEEILVEVNGESYEILKWPKGINGGNSKI